MVKRLKIRYETCLNMSKHVQWWQKDCNECLSRGTDCLPSLSKKFNERVEKSFQFSDKVVIKKGFLWIWFTRKSFLEALIVASTNPQYV